MKIQAALVLNGYIVGSGTGEIADVDESDVEAWR
jgi:hypothetical protein